MGNHRADLWATIPPLATTAVCYMCKQKPPDLLQCERCGVPVCASCYWTLVSPAERALRDADLDVGTDVYLFVCEFCRC